MSGLGNYTKIGSGLVAPSINDLPKIGEVKELGIEGRKAEGLNLAPIPDAQLERANYISAKLDALLLKAAKTASAPIDTKALKTASREARLDKTTRNAINDAAEKAAGAFKAIGRFTGSQIAAALKKDASGIFDFDMDNPVGKAIQEALDAQAALSEKLGEALNNLPKKATAAAQAALETTLLQADRRASELQTLVCEFADMAEKKGDDQEIAARLDKTLESLIPSQSLKMHGSEKIVADFRAALRPLAARIDALAAKKEFQLSDAEATKIRRQIDEAFNALSKARQSYAAKGIQLDSGLMDAAKGVVTDFNTRLAGIRREAAFTSMRNFADKVLAPPKIGILQEKFLPILSSFAPGLAMAVKTQKLLRAAAEKFLDKHDNASIQNMRRFAYDLAALAGNVAKDLAKLRSNDELVEGVIIFNISIPGRPELGRLIDALPNSLKKKCTPELVADFRNEFNEFLGNKRGDDLAAMGATFGALEYIDTQTDHLVEMFRNAAGHEIGDFLTNKTLLAAFEGKMDVTTLIETRMAGLPDEDADPALDGSNSVSSKRLGSGVVNTVHEIGYKDGSTFIFKPEAPGRQGMGGLQLSKGSYGNTQLVAQLNMASQKTADAFGLGDVMAKTSVGSYNGQFGLFMEKAPGMEAADFKKIGNGERKVKNCLTPAEIKALPDERYAKVMGEIMRKTNRLQWFDILTGQGDRHHHNYLVNVSPEGDVSLKAIDNDACFGLFMTGPGKFRLEGIHAQSFVAELAGVKKNLYPAEASGAQKRRIDSDPGIRRNEDGSIEIDTSKIKAPEINHCLREATGCHVTAAPDYIDEDLYDHLMTMEKGSPAREAYGKDLLKRLPISAVGVALERLDAAIARAKTLKAAGRVIAAEDWAKREVQRELAGSLPQINPNEPSKVLPKPLKNVGGVAPKDGKYAQDVADAATSSTAGLFRRDLMAHLAKPGWFDE